MTTQTRSKQSEKDKADPKVIDLLNHHLALTSDLYSQVKQAHWTVVGPNFIAIHRLFDEVASMAAAHGDTMAERIRSLQAIPRGTIREAVKESPLPEIAIGEIYEEGAIRAVLQRLEIYSHSVTDAIEECEKAEDPTTQDVFIDIQKEVDLQAYFLRSHLPSDAVMNESGDHAPSTRSSNGRHR
ncbi:MAG: DNA starvation/stationary phase protection protein [Chloroflexi bacterium]|nr:MAG: DNA starvation/stationary phase protection protein [Chloroflexota bacterium]